MSKVAPLQVLFLCADNSARSIMAEVMLRHWGGRRFVAHSAAPAPAEAVNLLALEVMDFNQLPTHGLRTKSWHEFTGSDAPMLDFVFTLSDVTAQEPYPAWNGMPVVTHWELPDPAREQRSSHHQVYAFQRALKDLELRIKEFVRLPLHDMAPAALQQQLTRIGRIKLLP